MSETKRYDLHQGGIGCMGCGSMVEDSLGDYVRFDDLPSPDLADALAEALRNLSTRGPSSSPCFCGMNVTHTAQCVEARAALARWETERKGK